MAGNDNKQEIVEKVDNNQLDYVFLKEKFRKADKVLAIWNKSREIFNIFSAKQDILARLYNEHISTSQTFTAIYHMKNDYVWFFVRNTAFLEIDEEVRVNSTLFEEFEEKLYRSREIVKKISPEIQAHHAKLQKELNTVRNAETLEDLDEVNVPTLKWVKSTTDPEIEQLADVWDKMQLKDRTTELLEKLRALI